MTYRLNFNRPCDAEKVMEAIENIFDDTCGVFCDESQIDDAVLIVKGLTENELMPFLPRDGRLFEIEEYDALNDEWKVIHDLFVSTE